jgi:hypothetical protein
MHFYYYYYSISIVLSAYYGEYTVFNFLEYKNSSYGVNENHFQKSSTTLV